MPDGRGCRGAPHQVAWQASVICTEQTTALTATVLQPQRHRHLRQVKTCLVASAGSHGKPLHMATDMSCMLKAAQRTCCGGCRS